jgi:hypothetical protein
VETEDPAVVLDPYDENERPEDEREHAEDVHGLERDGVPAREADAKGIEGTRPDVAVDDRERGDGEEEELPSPWLAGIPRRAALEGRRTFDDLAHSSICAPTSTTRFGGNRK